MQFVGLIIIITKINFFLPQQLKEKKLKISIKNISDLTNVSCVVCGPEYQLWCAIVPRANVGHIWFTTYLKNQEENHYNLELVSKELNHFGVIAGLFRQIGGHSSRFVLFCSF